VDLGGGGGGFSDFFRTFFGGGIDLEELFGQTGGAGGGGFRASSRREDQSVGRDVNVGVEITLEEAYRGTTRRLSLDGASSGGAFDVRIPPGVKDGSKVRVSGKGEKGRSGNAGDLYLEVKVVPHPLYRRDGDNLHVDVPVTFAEAALGAEIEVPTLAGRARIRIPAGSQTGRLMRLKGKGMPALKGGEPGDLFAKLLVVVPKELQPRELELVKELQTLRSDNPRAHLGCA
jgi:DnaJ-class molecular chaperone